MGDDDHSSYKGNVRLGSTAHTMVGPLPLLKAARRAESTSDAGRGGAGAGDASASDINIRCGVPARYLAALFICAPITGLSVGYVKFTGGAASGAASDVGGAPAADRYQLFYSAGRIQQTGGNIRSLLKAHLATSVGLAETRRENGPGCGTERLRGGGGGGGAARAPGTLGKSEITPVIPRWPSARIGRHAGRHEPPSRRAHATPTTKNFLVVGVGSRQQASSCDVAAQCEYPAPPHYWSYRATP
ncbi:hypothetical protein EVAR_85351_1 [Eumeta japonica]|uniref:Uncharacterized protein n=1 Tax=Eumeta variegata TaxID=151549 RepID=A0A4C1WRP0_EUMVA|nr:hypothetical protein EVAR_85351_1 [Eumeta japonica]